MSNILDTVQRSRQFTPETVEEYIALQLAKGLCDEPAVRRYVHYVAHYPTDRLLRLFHKSKQKPDPSQSFHSSLIIPEP